MSDRTEQFAHLTENILINIFRLALGHFAEAISVRAEKALLIAETKQAY